MTHAPADAANDAAVPAVPDLSGLPGLLAVWLPAQRWFAGKGRELTAVEVEQAVALSDSLVHLLIRVRYADGDDCYQVPMTSYPEPEPGLDQRRSGDAGSIGSAHGRHWYDALHDASGTATLLELLRTNASTGGLSATSTQQLEQLAGMPVGVEQSNTSIVYGDAYILKVFRRISPGTNPDLEVTRALAEAGSPHVAAPLGWIEGELDGEPTTFAVLQEFLRSGSEGWRLALASVRDLYAEGDLHADEVGGDFAGESERLGAATAAVHLALAQTLPARTAGADELAAESARMIERLEEALATVEQLRPFERGLRAAFDRLGNRDDGLHVQRIHGDYHLGQVLRIDSGWVLLDFEGEPARPLAERRAPASPLRDVAGMLRSYDYAARYLLLDRHDAATLAYRAEEWAERNRTAFCDGYTAALGADPRDEDVVLRAFELDKAVYEVMYEARHRPSWLTIPLSAIERLVG
ncbi:MAG TPA: aminoglycoside phosphotransferase [Frankiaceae bacterium]|nr:aminoglycoside phosphotransferase [Frankiaceae bacterium]